MIISGFSLAAFAATFFAGFAGAVFFTRAFAAAATGFLLTFAAGATFLVGVAFFAAVAFFETAALAATTFCTETATDFFAVDFDAVAVVIIVLLIYKSVVGLFN